MGAMYKDDWYSVDEDGRISNHMTFAEFTDPHIINDGVIRYVRNGNDYPPYNDRIYGLWDVTSGNRVPPVYSLITPTPLSTKWYSASQNTKSGFVKTDNTRLGFLYDVPFSPVNIDYRTNMIRFQPPTHLDSSGKAIYSMEGHFESVENPKERDLYLDLIIPPTDLRSEGMMIHVVNGMHLSDAKLNSVDGALMISIEAKDEDGDWKRITELPTSRCGNSYYPTNIPPKHQATYIFPEFEGSFQTELRVVLTGIMEETDDSAGFNRSTKTIYSRTFSGSINPAQLWRSHLAVP